MICPTRPSNAIPRLLVLSLLGSRLLLLVTIELLLILLTLLMLLDEEFVPLVRT